MNHFNTENSLNFGLFSVVVPGWSITMKSWWIYNVITYTLWVIDYDIPLEVSYAHFAVCLNLGIKKIIFPFFCNSRKDWLCNHNTYKWHAPKTQIYLVFVCQSIYSMSRVIIFKLRTIFSVFTSNILIYYTRVKNDWNWLNRWWNPLGE